MYSLFFVILASCLRIGSDAKVVNRSKTVVCIASRHQNASTWSSPHRVQPGHEKWLLNRLVGRHDLRVSRPTPEGRCDLTSVITKKIKMKIDREHIEVIHVSID